VGQAQKMAAPRAHTKAATTQKKLSKLQKLWMFNMGYGILARAHAIRAYAYTRTHIQTCKYTRTRARCGDAESVHGNDESLDICPPSPAKNASIYTTRTCMGFTQVYSHSNSSSAHSRAHACTHTHMQGHLPRAHTQHLAALPLHTTIYEYIHMYIYVYTSACMYMQTHSQHTHTHRASRAAADLFRICAQGEQRRRFHVKSTSATTINGCNSRSRKDLWHRCISMFIKIHRNR